MTTPRHAESTPVPEQRLADYAMVVDLLATLPAATDEAAAVAAVRELFLHLWAPSGIVYIPIVAGRPGPPQPPDTPTAGGPGLAAFLADDSLSSAWDGLAAGFLLRLRHQGNTLGVFAVLGLAFPQYRSHYLNLALAIAQVCGLAIHNARIYSQLRRSLAELETSQRAVATLNADLERRIAQVEAANRELDAFSYAVSHDLRAPLRAVTGFAGILREEHGAALPDGARVCLDHMTEASQRMGELIDGLLQLSRCTRGNLRADLIDLSALATRICQDLARTEPQRQVRWSVAPGLHAAGDARMIEAVLNNLLANAWKYTARTAEPRVCVDATTTADGEFFFRVADNGAGFDMRHAEKLFKPFQRLHRQDEFPGIGIGLATVQRIVKRHGGTLRATGAPGQGATFSFSLHPNPESVPVQP